MGCWIVLCASLSSCLVLICLYGLGDVFLLAFLFFLVGFWWTPEGILIVEWGCCLCSLCFFVIFVLVGLLFGFGGLVLFSLEDGLGGFPFGFLDFSSLGDFVCWIGLSLFFVLLVHLLLVSCLFWGMVALACFIP